MEGFRHGHEVCGFCSMEIAAMREQRDAALLQFEEARKIIEQVSHSPELKKWFDHYSGQWQDPLGVHAFTAKYAETPKHLGLDVATYEAAKKEQAQGERIPIEDAIKGLPTQGANDFCKRFGCGYIRDLHNDPAVRSCGDFMEKSKEDQW